MNMVFSLDVVMNGSWARGLVRLSPARQTEVSPMKKRLLSVVSVLTVGLLLPASVSADCSQGPEWPTLSEARGTTFVGTVIELGEGDGADFYTWDVERVYAGDLEPGRLERFGLGPPSCHPIVLRPGARYLVSSGYADGAAGAFSTVAYAMVGDGTVRLASWPERSRSSAPAVYRVDTFTEALGILLGMPPTDAIPAGGSSPALPLVLVFGVAAVTSGFVLRRRLG